MNYRASYWTSQHFYSIITERQLLNIQAEQINGVNGVNIEMLESIKGYFIQYIMQLTQSMQLVNKKIIRHRVLSAACHYFWRFFSKKGLHEYDPALVACTCLFLAGKVEEAQFSNYWSSFQSCLVDKRSFVSPKADSRKGVFDLKAITCTELTIMEQLDCNLVIHAPCNLLKDMINDCCKHKSESLRNKLTGTSWKLLNDQLLTPICLCYHPHTIALACFASACVIVDEEVQQQQQQQQQRQVQNTNQITNMFQRWLGNSDDDIDAVWEVSQKLINLYEREHQQYMYNISKGQVGSQPINNATVWHIIDLIEKSKSSKS